MAGRLKAEALAAAMKLRLESGGIDAPAGDSLETIEMGDWTKRGSWACLRLRRENVGSSSPMAPQKDNSFELTQNLKLLRVDRASEAILVSRP